MDNKVSKIFEELKTSIDAAYTQGVSVQEAERLAARCLSMRLTLADELRVTDLDARMKRHGVKAVKAAVYTQEVAKHEKKPSEGFLENAVNLDKMVADEESAYAQADTTKDQLANYLDIFKDAHIYFRGIAKGNYE